MREPAFNTIALLLTVYVAALVWGIQHVSDKYSPKLLMIFFLRLALLPLVVLVVILFGVGILLFPNTLTSSLTVGNLRLPSGDVLSFALLVAAVALVIAAVSLMVSRLAKGMSIISWLRKRKDQVTILEDILPNLIERNDVYLTREALSLALRGKPESCKDFVDWLEDHRSWLAINWLARELVTVILSPAFDSETTSIYDDVLCAMLAEALDKEDFTHAYFVLDKLCGPLSEAKPWTNAHMNLLCHVGFTLWKIGEYGASAPRAARIPEQLEYLRWIFLNRERRIQYCVLHLKDADSVCHFVLALCELIREAASTKNLCEVLLSRVYDVLVDGYEEHVLNTETLQELINGLGQIRHDIADSEDEETQAEIDSYILASLAILVELGEKEDIVLHAAGNGYMRYRIKKGKWSSTSKLKNEPYYYYWLSPECYDTVFKMLGLPGLSKKQIKEFFERRAALRPIEIQAEVESTTDKASDPLLGSSPTSPILIKVHSLNDLDGTNSDDIS